MALLKYDSSETYFLKENNYHKIDTISKDDIYALIDTVLNEAGAELQEYKEKTIQNVAHDIIYMHVYNKLLDVKNKRTELNDFFKNVYIEKIEKYKKEINEKVS